MNEVKRKTNFFGQNRLQFTTHFLPMMRKQNFFDIHFLKNKLNECSNIKDSEKALNKMIHFSSLTQLFIIDIINLSRKFFFQRKAKLGSCLQQIEKIKPNDINNLIDFFTHHYSTSNIFCIFHEEKKIISVLQERLKNTNSNDDDNENMIDSKIENETTNENNMNENIMERTNNELLNEANNNENMVDSENKNEGINAKQMIESHNKYETNDEDSNDKNIMVNENKKDITKDYSIAFTNIFDKNEEEKTPKQRKSLNIINFMIFEKLNDSNLLISKNENSTKTILEIQKINHLDIARYKKNEKNYNKKSKLNTIKDINQLEIEIPQKININFSKIIIQSGIQNIIIDGNPKYCNKLFYHMRNKHSPTKMNHFYYESEINIKQSQYKILCMNNDKLDPSSKIFFYNKSKIYFLCINDLETEILKRQILYLLQHLSSFTAEAKVVFILFESAENFSISSSKNFTITLKSFSSTQTIPVITLPSNGLKQEMIFNILA